MKYVILLLFLIISIDASEKGVQQKAFREVKLISRIQVKDFKKQTTKLGCFKACVNIVNNLGYKVVKSNKRIQTIVEQNDSLKVVNNYSSIDKSLKKGVPAIVGVHHTFNYGFNEGTTDHFVIIIAKGYDNSGVYYQFYDVATKYGTSSELKFRRLGNALTYNKYYVTQIRTLYSSDDTEHKS